MNSELKDLFDKSEGRYLTDIESGKLRSYADSLLTRLETSQAVERAEDSILSEVVEAVRERYPEIPNEHGSEAYSRVKRDVALVLRYATQSMVAADPHFIYDKLSVWLRTILFALCNPERIIFSNQMLLEACAHHLSDGDFAAIKPYLEVHNKEFTQGDA